MVLAIQPVKIDLNAVTGNQEKSVVVNPGQTITLTGAIHPWSSTITPLLPDFTRLTGINVITDFAPETTYLSAIPIRLARGRL